MRIFNFVDFESLIYMKLYNLYWSWIKYKNVKTNNVKALKKKKQALFPDVYCHVNKFVYSIPQYKPQIYDIIKVTK